MVALIEVPGKAIKCSYCPMIHLYWICPHCDARLMADAKTIKELAGARYCPKCFLPMTVNKFIFEES